MDERDEESQIELPTVGREVMKWDCGELESSRFVEKEPQLLSSSQLLPCRKVGPALSNVGLFFFKRKAGIPDLYVKS